MESGDANKLKIRRIPTQILTRGPTFQRTKTQLLDDKIKEATYKTADKLKSNATTDSSDEYDTDLEIEERTYTPLDRYGVVLYRRTCRRLGLNPVGSVMRGLKTQTLDVAGRGLNQQEVLVICRALIENRSVVNITWNDNQIGPVEAEIISAVIQDNPNIQSLELSENEVGIGVGILTEVLEHNTILKRLDLSDNHLHDQEAELLSSLIKVNNTLTYLNVSQNDFSDKGAKFLGGALAVNESLRVLDLSWNQIRASGAKQICAGLQDNVVLTSLNLAYNGLSVDGAKALATALQHNEVLTDLDLTCNRIFDEGAAAIGKALLVNVTLKKLKLANNPMTTVSAVTLLTVLKKNEYTALEHLDMSSIHLYKDALALIKDIQGQHPLFDFRYGGVVNSNDQWGKDGDLGINNRNPLTILKEYMAKKNFRLVDLFKQLDKDGSGSVSSDEFVHGLQVLEVPLTKNQLERLIAMLDKDGDGEVDYQELVTGDREHRRKQRAKMGAVMKIQTLTKRKTVKETDPKPPL